MLELFNTVNNAFCNFFGINSYLQGVIIMMCVNIIAVLGMSVLTGFTRLFSSATQASCPSALTRSRF